MAAAQAVLVIHTMKPRLYRGSVTDWNDAGSPCGIGGVHCYRCRARESLVMTRLVELVSVPYEVNMSFLHTDSVVALRISNNH